MLKSEEGQLNAVFACFGSAAQHSQFFEAALGDFLLAYNKLCKRSLTLADLETMERKLQKQTMGALLRALTEYVTVSDTTITERMTEAVQKRNFLIHDFFLQRRERFSSEQGRMNMLTELLAIERELEQATDLTNGMRVALCRVLEKGEPERTDEKVLFSMQVKMPDDYGGGD